MSSEPIKTDVLMHRQRKKEDRNDGGIHRSGLLLLLSQEKRHEQRCYIGLHNRVHDQQGDDD